MGGAARPDPADPRRVGRRAAPLGQLSAVFVGSADIRAQLPTEHARFAAASNEFQALVRRVVERPQGARAARIEHVGRQLERQTAILAKVQKALGEYLERQRAAFPRVYFVGEDDLLEIVGNSEGPAPRARRELPRCSRRSPRSPSPTPPTCVRRVATRGEVRLDLPARRARRRA